MYKEQKAQLHAALATPQTPVAVAFFVLIFATIIISIAAFIMESMHVYEDWWGWRPLEAIVVMLFTLEVSLRWWAWPSDNRSFFADPMTMIDVISVVPFYIELMLPASAAVDMRWVRVLRLINLFKVGRHSTGLQFMFLAMVRSFAGLMLLGFLLFQALLVFATAMWFLERGDWSDELHCYERGDDLCSPFQSIAHAAWWAITTMTTVGYGDSIPISVQGRYMGSVVMIGGIIMLALPTTVFGAQFAEEYSHMKFEQAAKASLANKAAISAEDELAELKKELTDLKVEMTELIPTVHDRVQKYMDERREDYARGSVYFKGTGHLVREAVSSLDDMVALLDDWSAVPSSTPVSPASHVTFEKLERGFEKLLAKKVESDLSKPLQEHLAKKEEPLSSTPVSPASEGSSAPVLALVSAGPAVSAGPSQPPADDAPPPGTAGP